MLFFVLAEAKITSANNTLNQAIPLNRTFNLIWWSALEYSPFKMNFVCWLLLLIHSIWGVSLHMVVQNEWPLNKWIKCDRNQFFFPSIRIIFHTLNPINLKLDQTKLCMVSTIYYSISCNIFVIWRMCEDKICMLY